MAVQVAWRKQISLRQKNSQLHGSQLKQSQMLSLSRESHKPPDSPQLNSQNLKKSLQKSTFSSNQEKGSVYIKVLTNYLQITGSIIAIDPSITSGAEPFDLETNCKQDQRQQKLDQYQSNSSNNKIQHEIIFSEGNTNEATNN
ncbi:hypothetical protein ABPG72_013196 [Tetrahymena utriculariae]